MRFWACLTAALLTTTASATPPAPAMTFTLVRDGVACEPDCPEWIAAEGEIKAGTARAFQAFLAEQDGKRRPLIISSNGGSVEDAMAMGRLIRARGLAVAVGRTMMLAPAEAPPQPGYASTYPAVCLSACTLILAGGVERYASPLAVIGVHEVKQQQTRIFVLRKYLVHYLIINGRKVEQSRQIVSERKNDVTSTAVDPAAVDARIVVYLKQMGVDPQLLDLMRTASPEQIHIMTADEEKATRMVSIRFATPAAMTTNLPDSGLAGEPLDPAAGAQAALQADQSFALEPSREGDERRLAAHFARRRGGAGVAATLALMASSPAPIRFGVNPSAAGLKRLASDRGRVLSLFLPDAMFCRIARDGDHIVMRADAPPTQTPGLPDPRAPLLLTPLRAVAGISRLVDEACPLPPAPQRQAALRPAANRRRLK